MKLGQDDCGILPASTAWHVRECPRQAAADCGLEARAPPELPQEDTAQKRSGAIAHLPECRAATECFPVLSGGADPLAERSAFMQVPLLPDTYRFRYQRDITDDAGMVLCAIGIAAALAN